MCRRVNCKTCGKPNWAGCGAHVEMVLGEVPKNDRCRCREMGTKAKVAATPAGTPTDTAFAKFRDWLKQ